MLSRGLIRLDVVLSDVPYSDINSSQALEAQKQDV